MLWCYTWHVWDLYQYKLLAQIRHWLARFKLQFLLDWNIWRVIRSYKLFRFIRCGIESVITVQALRLHVLIISTSVTEDLDKRVGIASLYTHSTAQCKTQYYIPFDTISRF
jgi:hypothetical protein